MNDHPLEWCIRAVFARFPAVSEIVCPRSLTGVVNPWTSDGLSWLDRLVPIVHQASDLLVWCPRCDSNAHWTDFESAASADWATGA